MKERGIIMRDFEVRAIREGRKTQTRRIVKLPVKDPATGGELAGCELNGILRNGEHVCPYGQPGDRLWVRETFTLTQHNLPVYRADSRDKDGKFWPSVHIDPHGVLWKQSTNMPRWASRITLEIVSLRAERLQDISEEDAKAEGCEWSHWSFPNSTRPWKSAYMALFESINGPGSWNLNPWVWVVEFKEVKP